MKKLFMTLLSVALLSSVACIAQSTRPYDETVDPMAQIDAALAEAGSTGRYVACQVGGNWCRWCLKFADFIKADEEIAKIVADNFVYIHVNYPTTDTPEPLLTRLGNPGRFGYPVIVLLKPDGSVLHIQDSGLLEQDDGYNREQVERFFRLWTPEAVEGSRKSN